MFVGSALLGLWLIPLILNSLGWASWPSLTILLLETGVLICLVGIVLGSLLDFLSLRRTARA